MKRVGFFILIWLFWKPGYADTLYVDRSMFASISKAIEASRDGDVILVKQGIYKEGTIVIDKSVHLIGQNEPVIDGESKNETITIKAHNVTIEGFTIRNVGYSYTDDWAGIRVEEKNGCTIRNNKLINTFFGIYLQKTRNTKVIDNLIFGEAKNEVNSGNGIHLWYCDSIFLKNNQVLNHRDGIYLEFVENSKVSDNLSKGNLRYGLHFMFSNNDHYLRNTFENNGTGVAVMFSDFIVMNDNNFINNWGSASYGLLLKEIKDGELKGNTFSSNTIGIYADGALRNTISDNNFISNGWAMNILGSSTDNVITRNNFLSNTFDLATNKSVNKNNYDENYWDQYSGYDLDKDGFGDVPYRPVKLFNYVTGRVKESIILLHSFFVDILNFAEKVTPMLTPIDLMDNNPKMKQYKR